MNHDAQLQDDRVGGGGDRSLRNAVRGVARSRGRDRTMMRHLRMIIRMAAFILVGLAISELLTMFIAAPLETQMTFVAGAGVVFSAAVLTWGER
jgi:hypothetical protein